MKNPFTERRIEFKVNKCGPRGGYNCTFPHDTIDVKDTEDDPVLRLTDGASRGATAPLKLQSPAT